MRLLESSTDFRQLAELVFQCITSLGSILFHFLQAKKQLPHRQRQHPPTPLAGQLLLRFPVVFMPYPDILC